MGIQLVCRPHPVVRALYIDFFCTGFGYHGDFIAAWEPGLLQSAVDDCTNLSGKVEDCNLFNLQTEAQQQVQKISIPSDLQPEDCNGPRVGLPGNGT
jgi:hypothetical protein